MPRRRPAPRSTRTPRRTAGTRDTFDRAFDELVANRALVPVPQRCPDAEPRYRMSAEMLERLERQRFLEHLARMDVNALREPTPEESDRALREALGRDDLHWSDVERSRHEAALTTFGYRCLDEEWCVGVRLTERDARPTLVVAVDGPPEQRRELLPEQYDGLPVVVEQAEP